MKPFKSLLTLALLVCSAALSAQAPVFEELEFEPDSLTKPYKPSGKNYVMIRSKRGSEGVNKTPAADAITSSEVTEIVLVYTETDPSALAEREEANRERWENLLKTYPELFQFSTTYKNVCQCTAAGDVEALKKSQGFYVYINGVVPKVAEDPAPVAAAPVPARVEEKKPAPAAAAPASAEKQKPAPATKAPDAAVPDKTNVTKEPPVVEKEPVKVAEKEHVKEAEPAEDTEEVKESPKKRPAAPAVTKPRRAKDPKACRPPCYGYGDEDLITFFKDNIPLNKKEKKKAKNWVANVRLQINHDGSIKKAMVAGTEEAFNLKVEEILKGMNNWNAAVKGGIAVKSEVRFTLKFDKDTKTIKPFDMLINPRPSPKCQCVSDSEIFAD